MGKNYDFDYIIIGSGPAGRTVTQNLANAKKSVAIVESGRFGGAELNRDLPYSLSLDFANTYHKFISFPAVNKNACHFNFPVLISSIDKKVSGKRSKILAEFKKSNIEILKGFSHFLDDTTIAVGEKKYSARNFVIATGSTLKLSDISGIDTIEYLTPDTALHTRKLPHFVFVVGGGSTGVEIAEYFASLGTGVIIMEKESHLLPREDADKAKNVTQNLKNLGATVVTNSRVTAITEDMNSKIVVFSSGSGEKMVRVDSIVLATGSEPFLDISLENANVEYKKSGIVVDKYYRTTSRNIYAIGDCIGGKDSSTARSTSEAEALSHKLLTK